MHAESQSSAPASLLASLRAGLVAGLRVGVLAGFVDGMAAAMGLDSEFFLIHASLEGVGAALPDFRPALAGIASEFGPLLGSALVYGLIASSATCLLALITHPLLRRLDALRRYQLYWGVSLGLWLGFATWWWTRPVVLAGYSSIHPARLIAMAGILAAGVGVGLLLERLSRRTSESVQRAGRIAATLAALGGALFLATDVPSGAERGVVNERNRDLPNVLIVIVDALRSDVLSCYGSQDVKTPVIDALAERGVLFENAFVQAPFTWSSFGSILTGKYPRRHGLVKMESGVRMAPNITLPFYLQGAMRKDGVQLEEGDFIGAAFMTGTLSHGSGLLRGFDTYCEALVGHDLVDLHSEWSRFRSGLLPWLFWSKLQQRIDPQRVASTAVDWFDSNSDKRFVSMVHYYSTHTPYAPQEPWRSEYLDASYEGPFTTFEAYHREAIEEGLYEPTEADIQQIKDLYYAGTAQADAMIGRVLDGLKANGTLDDTLVIITSDHGEELGEHGVWEHNFMYQTNLSIPLIMSWPGHLPEGVRVNSLVETVDIVPTVCELMGLDPPNRRARDGDKNTADEARDWLDGHNIVPLIEGKVDKVRDFSFAENGRFRSIQSLDQKLVVRRMLLEHGPDWQTSEAAGQLKALRFYDLSNDPLELNASASSDSEAVLFMFNELKRWSDSMPIGDNMLRQSAHDLKAQAKLKAQANLDALGYGGDFNEDDEDE